MGPAGAEIKCGQHTLPTPGAAAEKKQTARDFLWPGGLLGGREGFPLGAQGLLRDRSGRADLSFRRSAQAPAAAGPCRCYAGGFKRRLGGWRSSATPELLLLFSSPIPIPSPAGMPVRTVLAQAVLSRADGEATALESA